jgi:hypothetical protein
VYVSIRYKVVELSTHISTYPASMNGDLFDASLITARLCKPDLLWQYTIVKHTSNGFSCFAQIASRCQTRLDGCHVHTHCTSCVLRGVLAHHLRCSELAISHCCLTDWVAPT